MASAICIGVLAAFGCLCVLWTLLGWLLPHAGATTVVYLYISDLGQEYEIRRCRWLQDLGLLAGRLVVVDCGLSQQEKAQLEQKYQECEFCSLEDVSSGLELERRRFG